MADHDTSSDTSYVELENLDEKTGKAPERRLKDASSARSIFERFLLADQDSAFNRASVQAMFNGEPPYTERELIAAGQGYRCNINFDEAGDLLAKSMAPYIDMVQSVETIAHGMTTHGEEASARLEISQKIMQEFSNLLTGWDQYFPRHLVNSTYFVSQGVSFATFEDPWDWRYQITKFGDFLMAKNTPASEGEIEIAFRRKEYEAHELYEKISNVDAATKRGWDVKETRKAILEVASDEQGSRRMNWEKWEEEAKNNDLYMSSQSETVEVLHVLVKEFSGKVSHYILTVDGGEADDFLFENDEVYDDMTQAVTSFTYGVGTNGMYHSIRGLGYKIFPHIQVSNRLHCQMIDGAMLDSSVILQPKTAADMHKLSISYQGPYAMLAPDIDVIDKRRPNFSQNLMPVVNSMKEMVRSQTQQYTAADALPTGGEMSRFEASARIQAAAGLTVTNLVLFYEQFDRLLREVFRRVSKRNYPREMPGGEEVHQMRERLEEQDVDLEALYEFDLDSIRAVRAVGAGSDAAREDIFRNLTDISGAFDETGRKNLARDRVASQLKSYDAADRYMPAVGEERTPHDAKVAEFENLHMDEEQPVSVQESELHLTHLQVHMDNINQIIEAVENGQAQLTEVTRAMVLKHEHASEHLRHAQGDPLAVEDVAFFRQILQQAGEIVMNGVRALEAEEQAAIEEGGGGGEGEGPSLELRQKLQKHQLELQMADDVHRQKLQQRQEDASQKRALERAKTASDLDPNAQL